MVKYAPLILLLLMAHVVQNAPWIIMWDPPEGSWGKYPGLSVVHMRNAPLKFALSVAHVREYALLITCGPHLGPTGPTFVSVMRGAY
jgi:hypothetical protein